MLKPKDILALEALGLGGDGGGGSSVTVEPLTVTQNGTQTAPEGKAYSPVTVNVPNSYGASDEGKVVSNGALVAQTEHAPVTANGTIDTTLNNSVTVNVSGGGALQVKTVILMPGETGSISPDSGYAGMSRVDYDVGPAPTIYRAERSTEIEGVVLYEFPLYVDHFVIGTTPGGQIGLCFLPSAPYSFLVNAPERGEIGSFQGDAYLFPIVNGTNPNMYPQYIYAISPD